MSYTSAPNTTYPYSAVVSLIVQQTDGSYIQGSGVMISPNEVLTAAHVVDQAAAIEVVAGQAGLVAPWGIDYAASWTYDPAFTTTPGSDLLTQSQSQVDIGLIRLPDNLGDQTGWMGLQPGYAGGSLTVTGYPASYNGYMATESLPVAADPNYSVLDYANNAIGLGNSGGPLWVNSGTGPQVVGVVSTTAWATQITASLFSYIEADLSQHSVPPANPGPVATTVAYSDATTGVSGTAAAPAYSGPVPYLDSQFVYVGSDDLNVAASSPNMFLRTGSGNDALAAFSGNNVLDGGTGSNFLVGGTGQDVFFLDGRGAGVTWSTVVGFHAGDQVTLWGYVPGVSTLTWAANDGTAGYQGSTLHADLNGGGIDASLTFAGLSASVTSQFLEQTGTVQGNPYLHLTYT